MFVKDGFKLSVGQLQLETMTNKVKDIHGLTPKQEVFVQELLKGNSASDSYRTAYIALITYEYKVLTLIHI